jgi:hypothetical protein
VLEFGQFADQSPKQSNIIDGGRTNGQHGRLEKLLSI